MPQPAAWFSIVVVCTGCATSPQSGARSQRYFEWAIPDRADAALIEFAFPPPYDNYAGEIRKAEGWLRLRSGTDAAEGCFTVRIADVDMGDADLTRNVQTAAEMLRGGDFPAATFTLRAIEEADKLIQLAKASTQSGRSNENPVATEARLHGDLRLKGAIAPLVVPVRCEVIHDSDQRPMLTMTGEFALDKLDARYGITGPAPDEPEGDRVVVRFRFEMMTRSAALLPASVRAD